MDDFLIKNRKSFGYCNPSFSGAGNYSQNYGNQKALITHSVEHDVYNQTSDDYSGSVQGVQNSPRVSSRSKRSIRSTSDPCKNNITPLMDNLSLDTNKTQISSMETVSGSNPTRETSPALEKLHNVFLGGIIGNKHRDQDLDKVETRHSSSWPLTYVKPPSKPPHSGVTLNLKFSSRGLPNQSSNFTPLMYRRAISLRGHSNKHTPEGGTKNNTSKPGAGSLKTILRRSNSDKASASYPKSEEGNGANVQPSPLLSSIKRFGNHSSSTRGRSKEDNCKNSSEDAFSIRSDDSQESFDITEFVMQNVSGSRNSFQSSEDLANKLTYLNKNLEEYVLSLSEILLIYDKMKVISPDKIRQHFDFPLKLVRNMFKLQCDVNRQIKESKGNIGTISKVFMDDRFIGYQQYMIISPNIYESLRQYKDHFELNYPKFKNLIILPSSRLNFYAQILNSFLKFGSYYEQRELDRSIDYLEQLKRNANTEMTIKIIKDSPIDLHLGGKILQVGELNYVSGPLQKRLYYVIAFENMFVITISKVSYCTYVAHYRPEQILSVGGDGNLELIITIASSIHGTPEEHKFRSSDKELDKWFHLIDEWVLDTVASYEIASDSKNTISDYDTGRNFPLSLWQVFPFLKRLFQHNSQFVTNKFITMNYFCSLLIEREIEYIEKLNGIFNPETLPPPSELKDILQRILNLHELYFLPELKEAMKKNGTLVIDIFMNYLERFSEYKTYMIKRSLCTIQMPDGIRAQYYVTPIQHFAFYVEWSRGLGLIEIFKEASAYAVDTLLTYITDAKVTLLHEAIPNCCLDFYRTGELIKGGYMDIRVRPRVKGVRDGTYLILLFEKVLLILRKISPVYNLVFDMWIYQINFGPPSENPNSFKLEYRQGKNKSHLTFEFKTQNENSKNNWMKQLATELHSQAEEIKKCSALRNTT